MLTLTFDRILTLLSMDRRRRRQALLIRNNWSSRIMRASWKPSEMTTCGKCSRRVVCCTVCTALTSSQCSTALEQYHPRKLPKYETHCSSTLVGLESQACGSRFFSLLRYLPAYQRQSLEIGSCTMPVRGCESRRDREHTTAEHKKELHTLKQ